MSPTSRRVLGATSATLDRHGVDHALVALHGFGDAPGCLHPFLTGVARARQLRAIREMDIGAAQGFLLGRPDASVEMTFVDVRQLESGIVVPDAAHPVATPLPVGAIDDAAMDEISDERRALFLPRASGMEPSAGAL